MRRLYPEQPARIADVGAERASGGSFKALDERLIAHQRIR
jgi:hypothetical protein